jgi:hypothetical protein
MEHCTNWRRDLRWAVVGFSLFGSACGKSTKTADPDLSGAAAATGGAADGGGPSFGAGGSGPSSAAGGSGNSSGEAGAAGLLAIYPEEQLGPTYVGALAVDDTALYWIMGSQVYRGAKTGGTFTELSSGSGREVNRLMLDATHAWWMSNGSTINRVPKAGGPIEQFVAAQDISTAALWLGEDRLYFALSACLAMGSMEKDGTGLEMATRTGTDPGGSTRLSADDGYLYCGTIGALYRRPRAGGAIEEFVPNSRPCGVAFDTTTLYWLDSTILQHVFSMPKSGPPATKLVENVDGGGCQLYLDLPRRSLFWHTGYSLGAGRVYVLSLETLVLRALVDHRETSGAFTTDKDYVYWAEWRATAGGAQWTWPGSIWRMRKPDAGSSG